MFIRYQEPDKILRSPGLRLADFRLEKVPGP
jgi:hypothetical protein